MVEATIGAITWSDHAPILLQYNMSGSRGPGFATWRLNESLLQDSAVMEDVLKEVTCYFQDNDTPECAPGVIWEAHKAVIQGVLIKHRARM